MYKAVQKLRQFGCLCKNEISDLHFFIEKREDLSISSIRATIASCKRAELLPLDAFLSGFSMRPVTRAFTFVERRSCNAVNRRPEMAERRYHARLRANIRERSRTIPRRRSLPRLVKEKVTRNGAEERLSGR